MSLVDSLDDWTESARQISRRCDDLGFFPSGTYVPITLSSLGSVWDLPFWGAEDFDDAFSQSREVLDDLRGYLASHPHDLAVRWTVLAFLYDLSHEPAEEDNAAEWGVADRDEGDRARFREELEALVSLPDIADLTESQRVRWEIQNACFVSVFERAERLFQRLLELEPGKAASTCALVGEFHLLRALSADATDVVHCALGLATPATGLALKIGRWGVAVGEPLGPVEGSRLKEARYWFEKAVEGGFSLPGPGAAALGRCLFIEENYRRAAAVFEGILDGVGLTLEGEQAGFNDELNAALHLAVAHSHERTGNLAAAKVTLERCLGAHPKHGPAFRRLAELSITSDADYRGAYDVLARWADAEPELESDIWVRTLRGLGGTKGDRAVQRMLDEFFDAHPERLRWVESAVKAHWSALDRLSEKAKRQWLYGCWILWWRPPGFEAIDHANAATHFCRTLEIELRERVFARFVHSQGDLTDLRADLGRPERRHYARGKSAWVRLLKGEGTLGEMLTELDPTRESVLLASTRFREWLKERFPKMVGSFVGDEAKQINNVRRPSTHDGEETRARAEEACRLCRKYLEYLL